MQTHDTHPLAATLTRIVALDENFYADMGALESGWFRATDFMQAESSALEDALVHHSLRHPQMEQRTRGSYFIGEYSWFVPAPAIAGYLAEKRVPDLSPDNLALRLSNYTWHEGGESGEGQRL